MAASTTVYDVVTRYRTDHAPALGGTRQYRTEVDGLGRSLGNVQSLATGVFMGLGRFVGITGGIAGVGLAVHQGLTRTFRNLNSEMNESLALAAQINLAFRFSENPAQNFASSMRVSKGLFADLARDSARLPGELADFVNIARQISGAVFAGGGSVDLVRGLTARVALAAPAAGQSPDDAARQTMRALFGTASVGDNPLFAMMIGSQLFGPGMTTEKFNKLPAAERLQKFDEALAKLTDNPMFRNEIIRTFDTQLGTLADNLFGINGLLSQMGGRELFDATLDSLVEFNKAIEANTPTIVSGMAQLRGEIALWAGIVSNLPSLPEWLTKSFSDVAAAGGYLFQWGVKNPYDAGMSITRVLQEKGVSPNIIGDVQNEMHRLDLLREWSGGGRKAPAAGRNSPLRDPLDTTDARRSNPVPSVTQQTVHQTNYITVDLKSDDSPEAVAVKLGKAMEIAERHPTRAQRSISFVPASGAFRD